MLACGLMTYSTETQQRSQTDRLLQYQSSTVEVLDFDLKLTSTAISGYTIFSD